MIGRTLEGVRVIELCNMVAGPVTGLVLADLGADVIKVEHPDRGDDGRHAPPFFDGDGYFFTDNNRNKRSVGLDLKTPDGLALARRLALGADVVLDNFRLGVMERMGLDYETLSAENERIISCSVTSFGEGNAYSERPGYDPIMQALSGLMYVTGYEDDERPVRVGPSIVDKSAGLWGATAVLAALLERERSGKGQRVVVSLAGAVIHMMTQYIMRVLATGEEPERMGSAGRRGGPHGAFKAADGKWIMFMVGNQPMYQRFCEAAGRPELIDDPRFRTSPDRVTNHEEMVETVTAIFLEKPADEWVEILTAAGVPAGPVNRPTEFVADEELARQWFWSVERPTGTVMPQIHTPLSVLDGEAIERSAPPKLGQHTDEVLSEELALVEDEIAALRESGVIR